MATEETFHATTLVRELERRIQDEQRELVRARRARDEALARESEFRRELERVERALNISAVGQTRISGPSQATFPTGGGRAALLARRRELRALLMARPDQVVPTGATPLRGIF